jgi:GT2 family glycosyltransferase
MSAGVTAIVPVWNRRDLLARSLGGLRAQTYPIAEAVVVDDGSRDGSAELAESLGSRVVRMGAHGGFAKAVNRGIRESRTPLVAIVNNDVDLAPDWLEKLAAALEPGVWFATGRILQAAAPDRIDATYDALCRGGTPWRVGHARQDGPAFREPRQIRSAPFTAALFRAALFQQAGMLDERFESYLEDVDFGLRCALAGCAGRYAPDAVAWHQGSATLGRWHPETTRRMARNQVFLVAQALWGLVAVRHGAAWPWVRGKFEGFRRFPELRNVPAHQGVAEILYASEREIHRVQRQSGSDLYWTLYFLLTGGGAK